MKKYFSEEQIIGFPLEADAGVAVKEAKRLKVLEAENTRLKKLLAEQLFKDDVIKDAFRERW